MCIRCFGAADVLCHVILKCVMLTNTSNFSPCYPQLMYGSPSVPPQTDRDLGEIFLVEFHFAQFHADI